MELRDAARQRVIVIIVTRKHHLRIFCGEKRSVWQRRKDGRTDPSSSPVYTTMPSQHALQLLSPSQQLLQLLR